MKIWSVNTNQKDFGELGAKIFLEQNRVITWNGNNIEAINKGDLILAFNRNKSIVAVGYAVSDIFNYEGTPKPASGSYEQWINIDWIWKDSNLDNPIMLIDIDIDWSPISTIVNITKAINLEKLLAEIGKRKYKENK